MLFSGFLFGFMSVTERALRGTHTWKPILKICQFPRGRCSDASGTRLGDFPSTRVKPHVLTDFFLALLKLFGLFIKFFPIFYSLILLQCRHISLLTPISFISHWQMLQYTKFVVVTGTRTYKIE